MLRQAKRSVKYLYKEIILQGFVLQPVPLCIILSNEGDTVSIDTARTGFRYCWKLARNGCTVTSVQLVNIFIFLQFFAG